MVCQEREREERGGGGLLPKKIQIWSKEIKAQRAFNLRIPQKKIFMNIGWKIISIIRMGILRKHDTDAYHYT